MTEKKKIRLSALARTYNVGVHNLVELIEKKGLAGDGVNPSTVINEAQYSALEKEFGGSKSEKVNIREVLRSTTESATVAATNVVRSKEAPQKEELAVKSNVIFTTPSHEMRGPKIVGHVNLDQTTSSSSSVAAAAVAPKEEPRQEPVSQPEHKVEASQTKEVVETILPKSEPAKVEVAAPAKSEPVAEQIKAAPVVEQKVQPQVASLVEPKDVASAKAVSPVPSAPSVPVAQPAKQESIDPVVVPEKQEAPAVVDPNALFRANVPEKLSGPKILGKMVLPLPTNNSGAAGRSKRNRIKKNKVDVSKTPGTGAPARGGANGAGAPMGGGARPSGGGANRPSHQAGGNRQNNNPRPKPAVKVEVSDADVQNQIKETLARLTGKGSKTKSSKYRRDKRDAVHGRMAQEAAKAEKGSDTLQVTEFVTVSELATMMDVSVNEVIAACMNLGLMVSINQRLDAEALAIVAEEFGYKVEFVAVEIQEAIDTEEDKPEDMESRPPIVTVMGHVDHGKTSLLDYIRKANVIAGEAGGITQHIGAYSVRLDDGRKVTFLDTPGHEAFTAMRARGAKMTDVAIIIVAADDAIMPQTLEAINHASAAGVPIIFAINKIDKPSANPDRIKEQLSAMNYMIEEWGGKYQSEDISAKSGLNVDKLLEKIVLEAELLELKANPNRKASGSVIESTLDKGRGYVTTMLVQNGTLNVGDVVLSGIYTGRVKAMFNERGKKIASAGPATPVLVLGLNGAPQAGDLFNVMEDDKAAREIATKREQLQRMQGLRTQKHITLDEIGRRIAIGSFKELNIIVKGDVDGSIEALTDSLIKLSNEEVQVNVIHKAVGAISESDVLLAAASNAIIVGFQVRPSSAARKIAEKEEIDIRLYSIIYDAIGEIKDAIEGMLAPETKEEITSSVEVLEIFKITKVGTVAGCIVREGKITRGSKIRIIRDGIVVYTGKLSSLKRFKEEVKEVTIHTECGLAIDNYNDIKTGDFVESYIEVEVARKL